MGQDKLSSPESPVSAELVDALRRYPLLRSVTYGIGMNLIGFAAARVFDPTRDREWSMPYVLAVHSLAMPFMSGLSFAFAKLRPKDAAWWKEAVREHRVQSFGLGIVLGGTAFLLKTEVAFALGWVSFPGPGWHHASKPAVAWTLVSHLANLCVAWNEEMLYRGYGLYSLREAIGLPGAVAILVPLFASGHAPGWRTFVGQSALGLSTTALWLVGNSLWLPVGYHAAWNYVQTAILGPPDAAPSLLPMQVDGPTLWMGRPGYPEPGLLAAVTNFVVAGAAIIVWWRRMRSTPPR